MGPAKVLKSDKIIYMVREQELKEKFTLFIGELFDCFGLDDVFGENGVGNVGLETD